MFEYADDFKKLHDKAYGLLLKCLDCKPTDRRQKQSLELLANAVQLLHAASINMGVVKVRDPS